MSGDRKFRTGDKVRLVSGKLNMTVFGYVPKDLSQSISLTDLPPTIEVLVQCEWHDNYGKPQSRCYPEEMLVTAN